MSSMIRRSLGRLLLAALLAMTVFAAAAAEPSSLWYGEDEAGEPTVILYYFWSESCPHCKKANPVIRDMARELPWLDVRSLDVSRPVAVELYLLMGRLLGEEASAVPAFFSCGKLETGFGSAETTGVRMRQGLEACRERLLSGQMQETRAAPPPPAPIEVPLFGQIDPGSMSLPVFTAVIAGLDAFNPCAFFVLLFLLSLLVHTPSRARMALVGGIFVAASGLVYFAFMAAWLNLFLLAGEIRWVTVIAAVAAIGLALVNIKDFFWFGKGVSLGIPEDAKPRLYTRMRSLVGASSLPAMLAGTVALALAANSYELLCTSGFPMVFTRVLTLNELPTTGYYLYLAYYNLVYVLPLLVIVTIFVVTMGSRKLQEGEGRALKLLSGLMMLGLGVVLLLDPGLLSDLRIAVGLLGIAIVVTALVIGAARLRQRRHA